VHRDVKPSNVLVDGRNHGYLSDFGIARINDPGRRTLTARGGGTLAYIAPEVISGREAGPASDRYSFAAVLFEVLCGDLVFPYDTDAAIVYAHATEPPPEITRRRPDLPPAVDQVLIRGLAKDPAERQTSAS